jgi:hypothetical protein
MPSLILLEMGVNTIPKWDVYLVGGDWNMDYDFPFILGIINHPN